MPNRDGKLTKSDKEKVATVLNEKGVVGCPACKESPGPFVNDYLVMLGTANRTATKHLVYPVVVVGCPNCGLTRLFSAVRHGIPRVEEWKDD